MAQDMKRNKLMAKDDTGFTAYQAVASPKANKTKRDI